MSHPMRLTILAAILAAGLIVQPARAGEPAGLPFQFKVRPERPRVFLRAKAWDGPSIEKIKSWMDRPEYKEYWDKKVAPSELSINRLLAYVLAGDEAAGKQALDRYMTQLGGGTSPSYWGIKDQRMAALYDWLHGHPAFTAEMKKDKLAQLERRCQANMQYLTKTKENPFYSRFAGALAGLTTCALAMHGDSPKADEYLKFAYDCLRDKMGSIRQAEDGATGGSSYGFHHEFTDLANTVAAWRSATDWDAAAWIRDHQRDWLRRQMHFQIWMTYPSGRFVKDGDGWGRDTADDRQYRMSVDAVTGMYRDGVGRTWADAMHKRWGLDDYHSEYVWQFFVFNDPTVPPKPLTDLGRAAVFSPEFMGYVCWRSGWEDDATIVHFRAGESGDTHATWDAGKFTVFKARPLAIKNGDYIKFMDPHHRYYKSPASANCVLFGVEGPGGAMAAAKAPKGDLTFGVTNFKFSHANPLWPDGLFDWEQWKRLRAASLDRSVMGTLTSADSNERFARASADLSYRLKPAGQPEQLVWAWQRELVFLDYRYLLVLDRVRGGRDSGGQPIVHAWTLHTTFEPAVEGDLAVADNGPARLFCRTLLPAKARLAKVGGPGRECDAYGTNYLPAGATELNPAKLGPHSQTGAWRLDVTPAGGPTPQETTYLHVLWATDNKTDKMPDCSVRETPGGLVVKIGSLDHTFSPPAATGTPGHD